MCENSAQVFRVAQGRCASYCEPCKYPCRDRSSFPSRRNGRKIRAACDCVVVVGNSAWADAIVFRPVVRWCCCFLPVRGPFPSYFHPQSFAVVDVVGPTNLVAVEDEPPYVVVVLNVCSNIGFLLW